MIQPEKGHKTQKSKTSTPPGASRERKEKSQPEIVTEDLYDALYTDLFEELYFV